jgi:eukaryotic-like serine/threonine-protein kinase
MPLDAHHRLGPYEIVSPLGAGGMGEVYRARDTRLDRTVAIKVLPEALAADAAFRERFDREARAISQLTHPNICTLHDVGHEGGVHYLVLEHLDGVTLESRLTSGALPVADALRIANEIGAALDVAHRAGIVHRDLKPGNVMLTRSGAKLLDFGLAKSAAPVIAVSGVSMLPTTPPSITAQGAILGTFQYMAPEQIDGADADARTDIFAFGCVVYEMLTGRKAFEGKTRAALLGAILKDEPAPVSQLQPQAPCALDRVVATCLAKEPDDRWQTMRDLLRELRWAATATDAPPVPVEAQRRVGGARARVLWALATLCGIAAVAASVLVLRAPRATAGDPVRFTIAGPDNSFFSGSTPQIAMSPDGRTIAFVATLDNRTQLWVRALDDLAARPLAGTEMASMPFWSPDSHSIGFFAAGRLKRIQLAGGPPVTLTEAALPRGGTWNAADDIVFVPASGPGVFRVSANGGAATPLPINGPGLGSLVRWPRFLPDGRRFLLWRLVPEGFSLGEIVVASIDNTAIHPVLSGASQADYACGHLFFWRDASLLAQPVDPNTFGATGPPIPVGEQVGYDPSLRAAAFSASARCAVAFARGSSRIETKLTWVDRSGAAVGLVGEPGQYSNVALARDERSVAASMTSGGMPNRDIWVIDARSVARRLTTAEGVEANPAWSPDGRRIAFVASINPGLHVINANGSGEEHWVVKDGIGGANDWSRDGRWIAFWNVSAATGGDIWLVPTSGDHTPVPFATTKFNEQDASFSPDGRWIAYASDESGHMEIYLSPLPPNGDKIRISKDGGEQPMWRGDGRELFFLAPNSTLMAVPIRAAADGRTLEAGAIQPLFNTGILMTQRRQYAPGGGGRRFLVNAAERRNYNATPLVVTLNWRPAGR